MIRKISLILLLSIILVSCSDDKEAFMPNDPLNTTSLMKMYIHQDNYEGFKSLFMDGTTAEVTETHFIKLKDIISPKAGIDNFTLLSLDNGEMVLVHLSPIPNEEGEVLIQDVINIPDEMKDFFSKAINP